MRNGLGKLLPSEAVSHSLTSALTHSLLHQHQLVTELLTARADLAVDGQLLSAVGERPLLDRLRIVLAELHRAGEHRRITFPGHHRRDIDRVATHRDGVLRCGAIDRVRHLGRRLAHLSRVSTVDGEPGGRLGDLERHLLRHHLPLALCGIENVGAGVVGVSSLRARGGGSQGDEREQQSARYLSHVHRGRQGDVRTARAVARRCRRAHSEESRGATWNSSHHSRRRPARFVRQSTSAPTMRSVLAASLLVLSACATVRTGTTADPRDGTALLARMHDRYAGRWFRTLTFVQRTVQRRPDGTEQVTTWYEAQRGPRLRIDFGEPALGNGALYTADSLYVIRAGKVVQRQAEGNPFLPLIVSVYLEPLDLTVKQLAPYKIDLSRIRVQDWDGKPTYVVGATSPSDTTSPQFWVEKDRLIVTRFMVPLVPSPEGRLQDVRLENNVPAGGGWLATRIRMLDKGAPMQTEEYFDWHVDVPLAESLFQAERWSEGPHWRREAPR